MIEVLLTEEELDRCWDHAKAIVEHYAKRSSTGSGSYGHNKISSNVIGVKVEVAGSKWLREQLPTAVVAEHFWDFLSNADNGDIEVLIGNLQSKGVIEAKGVTDEQWETVHGKYGLPLRRMVTPKQLKSYLAHGAVILGEPPAGIGSTRTCGCAVGTWPRICGTRASRCGPSATTSTSRTTIS